MLLINCFFAAGQCLGTPVFEIGDLAGRGVDVDATLAVLRAHGAPSRSLTYPSDVGDFPEVVTRAPLQRAIIEQTIDPEIDVVVVNETGSTNIDAAKQFSGRWLVVTAERQSAGRGRLERQWVSPHAAGIAMSIAIPRDDVVLPIGLLPLASGLAVSQVLQSVGADCVMKWPNDLLLRTDDGDRKVGGILTELHRDCAVVGIGVNVSLTEDELPTPEATSLSINGIVCSRDLLISRITGAMKSTMQVDFDLNSYRELCVTLGKRVRVVTPSGDIEGIATDIDELGNVVVQTEKDTYHVSVGDVVHLRTTA